MEFELGVVLSAATICFPLVVCAVKYRSMSRDYRPFAFVILAGFITEMASYYSGAKYGNSMPVINVFNLFESFLLVFQFHRWGFLTGPGKRFLYALFGIMLLGWLADNLVFSSIYVANRYYLVSYCFLLVLLSIRQINKDMVKGATRRDELARLIICIGILFFFTLSITREPFTIFARLFSAELRTRIYLIIVIANPIANIIYGFGALYIPKQKNWPDIFRNNLR